MCTCAAAAPHTHPRACFLTQRMHASSQNIKKVQETMKMSIKKFLETASALEIDVEGNTLRGEPRTFSSGSVGWYLGGKILMKIGGTEIWAQLGCNVVIPGSNAWKK